VFQQASATKDARSQSLIFSQLSMMDFSAAALRPAGFAPRAFAALTAFGGERRPSLLKSLCRHAARFIYG